ncbi:hypothetical protein [Gehongia tenuis]|uniref:Uncharacterized protein n=1 Tax=Gehongia tenuis TaxID=2763655 RepID=A0A926D3V5_9FIRM|nr:hypothetical protein [Gehongia tenuis]MBC8531061.1 hypothetical protein [Gehongia tenuis]
MLPTQRKDINFLVRYNDHPERRTHFWKKVGMIAPLAVLAAVLLAVFVVFQLSVNRQNRELAAIESYISEASAGYDEVLALEGNRNNLVDAKAYLDGIATAMAGYPRLDRELFDRIAACCDDEFTIESYQYADGVLELGAKASSAEVMPKAVEKLRGTGLFGEIQYKGYTSGTDGSFACTIGCTLMPEQQ